MTPAGRFFWATAAPSRRATSSPHALHAAHAVTGAVCVASACALEGTIAHELATPDTANPRTIWIEHPSGSVDVRLETKGKGKDMDVIAGTLRTARPIMKGEVLVPRSVLQQPSS